MGGLRSQSKTETLRGGLTFPEPEGLSSDRLGGRTGGVVL